MAVVFSGGRAPDRPVLGEVHSTWIQYQIYILDPT